MSSDSNQNSEADGSESVRDGNSGILYMVRFLSVSTKIMGMNVNVGLLCFNLFYHQIVRIIYRSTIYVRVMTMVLSVVISILFYFAAVAKAGILCIGS